jgi:hypothetical protein
VLAVAVSSLAHALAFEVTAGIYAYAAFLPAALALSAAAATRLPPLPGRLGGRPAARVAAVALAALAAGDALALATG